MPPFFRLKSAFGGGWPELPEAKLLPIWSAYQHLDRSQWLSPDEIVERQLDQFRTLIRHCRTHVPNYRRRFAAFDPNAIRSLDDVRRLPVLKRTEIGATGDALLAEALPPGVAEIGIAYTSGSSGVPVEVRQTNRDQIFWFACYLRDLEWCGFDPTGSLASIRKFRSTTPGFQERLARGVTQDGWIPPLNALFESGPAHIFDLGQPIARQLEWLAQTNPDYLIGYPSQLSLLADLAVETGVRPRNLRGIQTISEALFEETRTRIESAFGCRVFNLYSCCEAGYLASPCPAGHGLHVHAENVLIEILDDGGKPCPVGVPGRVVVTTLQNYRKPFVRYEILDEAVAGPVCPCGRGLPLLLRVDGKRRPSIRVGTERRSSSILAQIFQKLQGVVQYQVVQRADDRLTVRIVPNREWHESSAAKLGGDLDAFFGERGRFDLELTKRIAPDAGGKVFDFYVEEPIRPASVP